VFLLVLLAAFAIQLAIAIAIDAFIFQKAAIVVINADLFMYFICLAHSTAFISSCAYSE